MHIHIGPEMPGIDRRTQGGEGVGEGLLEANAVLGREVRARLGIRIGRVGCGRKEEHSEEGGE